MLRASFLLFLLPFSLAATAGELACPQSLPHTDEVVIAFDGMKGFCPHTASAKLPQWDGSPAALDQLYMAKDLSGYSRLLRKLEVEHNFFHNCYFLKTIMTAAQVAQHPRAILYYSRRGYREALSCALSLQKRADGTGRELKFTVMGYSLGGTAAFRLTRSLQRAGIRVQDLLTVDPVGGNFRTFKSTLFRGGSPRYFVKTEGMPSWKNIYQTTDRRSITHEFPLPIGIRGNAVAGADNIRLDLGNYGHLKILEEEETLDAVLLLVQDSAFPLIPGKRALGSEFELPEN